MIVASRPSRRQQGRVLVVVLAVLFLGLLVAGALPRLAQSKAREAERGQVNAAPTVFTETVRADTTSTPLELPASVTGLHETLSLIHI